MVGLIFLNSSLVTFKSLMPAMFSALKTPVVSCRFSTMIRPSVMAKVAMAIMTKLKPSNRSMLPKVKRCTPEV